MGGGGSPSTDMAVLTNLIPTYIPNFQDWAIGYLDDATLLSDANYKPYTGSTYAAQNADEINGISALAARGVSGDHIEEYGETYLRSLLTDGYVEANARLDADFQSKIDELIEEMGDDILPTIANAHMFSFGGSEHNVDEARAAKRMMTKINGISKSVYYDDYRHERNIQNDGLNHAIPYGQREMRDAEIQRNAGVYIREYAQGSLQDAWNLWTEGQTIPTKNLDILGNAVRSVLGTTRTSTVKYYEPPVLSKIAGAALAGVSISGLFRDTSLNNYTKPVATDNAIQG